MSDVAGDAGATAAGDDGTLLSAASIDAGFRAAAAELGRFNLGLFGLTGAGKSTLLNAIFGAELAATGIGAPVTQTSRLYRVETASLGIYDTKGLELGSGMTEILAELTAFVQANRLGPEDEQLHVIWYCVRAGDRRIQPAEADFIRGVANIGIPVILVMTQTPLTPDGKVHSEAVELADAIRGLHLPVRGDVHFVNALADPFAGVGTHGLDALLEFTAALAPEGVRNALAAAQRVNASIKAVRAATVVAGATERVRHKAVVARSLGETWVTMFAEIATIYDIDESTARAVLDSADLVPRLRRLVYTSNAGVLLMPAVAVAGLAATSATAAGKRMADRRHPKALPPAPTASDTPPKAKALGLGWVAARSTAALGQAWAATCEHFWSAAYPDPPRGLSTDEVARRFNDEAQARLPVGVRRLRKKRS